MLTDEGLAKVKAELRGAFTPFRCVAEDFDYKQKLRFKVFDRSGDGIVEVREVVLNKLNESLLQGIIRETRDLIRAKGFVLN